MVLASDWTRHSHYSQNYNSGIIHRSWYWLDDQTFRIKKNIFFKIDSPWGDPIMKFLRLFLSAHLSDRKNFSWHCPCPSSDVRPGANTGEWGQSYIVGPILYCGANPIQCLHFRAKCVKICIGLAPRSDVGGWTSEVGQEQCQEKFFMVGRSVGRRGVGRQRAELDGGQRPDRSFYFSLEPP